MAELETMHAVFHAFGRTQAEALVTLKEGWREHFQRAGLPVPPFHYFEGLVRYVEASYGCAYHDFDLLLARPSDA